MKLVYLPPYSPDLNPIEEFFAELKGFIKRSWKFYEEDPNQRFNVFEVKCSLLEPAILPPKFLAPDKNSCQIELVKAPRGKCR